MDMESFQAFQTDTCERSKAALWTVWVPKSAEVFRRTPPLYINGDAEAYYMSVALLQSNQLRQLVQDSMDAFVAFFATHTLNRTQLEPDPRGDQALWSVPPAFVVELKVVDGPPVEYRFQPTFREIEDMCLGVLEAFVTAVSGIPRVGSASAAPSRRGLHIPAVGLKEECVAAARESLRNVLQQNAQPPRRLAALYDRFMYLLDMDKEAAMEAFKAGEHTLEEYAAEIDKYKSEIAAIEDTSVDEVRTGLYVIRMGAFKAALVESAEELVALLVDQVREAAHGSNTQVAEKYSLMSTEVMKVPANGEEVLTLKKYIGECLEEHDKLKEQLAFNMQVRARVNSQTPTDVFSPPK